ncbi:MAG: hypothetical protein ACKOH8_00615, partial [Gemmatimonadota bacterium]
MSAAAPLDLRRPPADPRVQHVLMLRERIDKTARNGKPYAILKLGNASGEITANAWEEHLPDLQGISAGALLQVIGEFETREGKRQLKLTRVTA